MAGNINRVIITGNLTKDPELKSFPDTGTTVCSMRIACNGRRKNNESGQWEDAPNYFDVSVFGQQGDNCARYLKKGRGVAVDGRLRWREWQTQEGQKRQSVDIIAETVQFLGGARDDAGASGNGFSSGVRAAEGDIPVDTGDFVGAATGGAAADDDIPF